MNLLSACSSYNISFPYVTSGLTKINSNYTKSYNFSDSYIESVCAEIQDPFLFTYNLVDTTLQLASMINLALLLVIIILSIFGTRNEEYKWGFDQFAKYL
uniref:Uncharacterized protein n=1 Tax=Acrobeloides nanus TaxID=290746 RepID=A0A914DKK2_9BILA